MTLRKLQRTAQRFEPISLGEMDKVALLNRVDTKFVLRDIQLLAILENVHDQYRILQIEDVALQNYQTVYFDTADFALYRQHHNGNFDRYKIRYRHYVDSGPTYLEIKRRTNKGRTLKKRQLVPTVSQRMLIEESEQVFIYKHLLGDSAQYDVAQLRPTLWNHFVRLTLVNKRGIERLTLDVGLEFKRGHSHKALSGIAIAEVKQERLSRESPFFQQVRQLHIRPTGFSKYCVGAALLYPFLKQNRFKEKLLSVQKLSAVAT